MAKDANINIRIEKEVKSNAEALFASFGITVSDAIKIFLHQSLMTGGLPFEVRQPRYNRESELAMDEARQIIAGKKKSKSYQSASDMINDLDGE